LEIYPNGFSSSCNEWISCRFLNLSDERKYAAVSISVTKCTANDEEVIIYSGNENNARNFESEGCTESSWDTEKLVSHEQLDNHKVRGTLSFLIDIAVYGNPATTSSPLKKHMNSPVEMDFSPPVHSNHEIDRPIRHIRSLYSSTVCLGNNPLIWQEVKAANDESPCEEYRQPYIPTLIDHIKSLHNNPTLSDITLTCEGEKVFAHKVILSIRSPTFQAKFQTKYFQIMNTLHSGQYELKSLEPKVFTELVRFIYTDACRCAISHMSVF